MISQPAGPWKHRGIDRLGNFQHGLDVFLSLYLSVSKCHLVITSGDLRRPQNKRKSGGLMLDINLMNRWNSSRVESKWVLRLEYGFDFARGVAGDIIALNKRLFTAKKARRRGPWM